MKNVLGKSLNIFMLFVMVCSLCLGCTLEASAEAKKQRSEINSRVARMIDETFADMDVNVVSLLKEDTDLASLYDVDVIASLSGEEIVSRALEEKGGEQYVDFSYEVLSSTDTNDILAAAKPLIPDKEYQELKAKVEEQEARAIELFEESARALSTEEQKAFYKDLKKMVVKAVVLLTAGIVYAFIPKVMVWGKVSAACVAAVAAGILASSILTVFQYRNFENEMPAFEAWIEGLYQDSYASWAIAATMISTGTASKQSPVIIGVILAAFSLYGVIKDVRPLLRKYGYNV